MPGCELRRIPLARTPVNKAVGSPGLLLAVDLDEQHPRVDQSRYDREERARHQPVEPSRPHPKHGETRDHHRQRADLAQHHPQHEGEAQVGPHGPHCRSRGSWMATIHTQAASPTTSTSAPSKPFPCPGTSPKTDAVSTATSRMRASAARPARPECGSETIVCRLMETPTNTSPVSTPAAPAWAKKKSCHAFTSASPLRRASQRSVDAPSGSRGCGSVGSHLREPFSKRTS